MSHDTPQAWSRELLIAIMHAHSAHSQHGNTSDDNVRFHDHKTPYLVHPLWCAATLLQEPKIPIELRQSGAIALLWHDTLEDTNLPLPSESPEEVARLVEGMTFTSFAEEQSEIWSRSPEIKLLKLYDKVSNLLDGAWMKPEKWNAYVAHTIRLTSEVEQLFGQLGIIKIAKAIAVPK